MVDEIKNLGESVEETAGENIDPKAEIKLGASENIATSFQDKKSDSKESKETFVKSLEFEENTFKIDSTGWIEATMENFRNHPEIENLIKKFMIKNVTVKVNATGDVVEYLDGPFEGEQIFITYDAFIREVMKAKNCTLEEIESKYLMTENEFEEKMADKPDNSKEYKKFFNQEIKGHLAGLWDVWSEEFYDIGHFSYIWLAHADNVIFTKCSWHLDSSYWNHGFSGRLLKN